MGQELQGKVTLNYVGRFDSVVINSQIENSCDIFNYVNLDGKKINHPYGRLSIFKTDLHDPISISFTTITQHLPLSKSKPSNAKFRVAIIQEHKEVASDVAYVKVLRN